MPMIVVGLMNAKQKISILHIINIKFQ